MFPAPFRTHSPPAAPSTLLPRSSLSGRSFVPLLTAPPSGRGSASSRASAFSSLPSGPLSSAISSRNTLPLAVSSIITSFPSVAVLNPSSCTASLGTISPSSSVTISNDPLSSAAPALRQLSLPPSGTTAPAAVPSFRTSLPPSGAATLAAFRPASSGCRLAPPLSACHLQETSRPGPKGMRRPQSSP